MRVRLGELKLCLGDALSRQIWLFGEDSLLGVVSLGLGCLEEEVVGGEW